MLFALLEVAGLAAVFPQGGSSDPIFATIPFDRWLAGPDHAQIPWKVSIYTPALSNHQRLEAVVRVYVDGKDLAKRPTKGQLLMLVQFNDSGGRVYRGHGTFELKEVGTDAGQVDLYYTHHVFVVPGDYRIAVGLFHTETEEHSFARRMLHVTPLKNDPLPEAWRDLPPVEILSDNDPPDDWFLPSVTGKLHLPLETRRPVHVELLMNLPPEQQASGRPNRASMAALLSALKVLSQVDVRNGSLDIALLDLARRRVGFEQAKVLGLDWPQLKLALTESKSKVIDVHALERRTQNAEFFVSQISRRIEARKTPAGQGPAEPLHVLIVLSPPMEFGPGMDLHPIQLDDNPGCSIYYIRYHWPPMASMLERLFPSSARPGRRGGSPPMPPVRRLPVEPIDSLANTLKPLHPRLFDVANPEQFRKALATLLDEISRM